MTSLLALGQATWTSSCTVPAHPAPGLRCACMHRASPTQPGRSWGPSSSCIHLPSRCFSFDHGRTSCMSQAHSAWVFRVGRHNSVTVTNTGRPGLESPFYLLPAVVSCAGDLTSLRCSLENEDTIYICRVIK